jgi:hypothetical protein
MKGTMPFSIKTPLNGEHLLLEYKHMPFPSPQSPFPLLNCRPSKSTQAIRYILPDIAA